MVEIQKIRKVRTESTIMHLATYVIINFDERKIYFMENIVIF